MKMPGSSSRKTFILLIVAFVAHNSEEAFSMAGKVVQSPFASIKPMDYRQFLFAVSFLSFAALVACIFALKTKNGRIYLFISTAIASGLLINAFIPHIAIAIYTMQYTPGLVTAVVLNLPLSLLLLGINKSFFENRKQMTYQMISGLALVYGLFVLSVGLAKIVF
jgi:hypothetical protein